MHEGEVDRSGNPPSTAPPVIGCASPTRCRAVQLRFDRRGFLGALGWALAALAVPLKAGARGLASARDWLGPAPRFFDDHERATLEALCDRILPPDARSRARGARRGALHRAAAHGVRRAATAAPLRRRSVQRPQSVSRIRSAARPSRRRPRNAFATLDRADAAAGALLARRALRLGRRPGCPRTSTRSGAARCAACATSTATGSRRSTRSRRRRGGAAVRRARRPRSRTRCSRCSTAGASSRPIRVRGGRTLPRHR